MEHNILIPLLLTLGAGLATGIGSAIAFFARRTNKRLLSISSTMCASWGFSNEGTSRSMMPMSSPATRSSCAWA